VIALSQGQITQPVQAECDAPRLADFAAQRQAALDERVSLFVIGLLKGDIAEVVERKACAPRSPRLKRS
jgi:hypothetical protein